MCYDDHVLDADKNSDSSTCSQPCFLVFRIKQRVGDDDDISKPASCTNISLHIE